MYYSSSNKIIVEPDLLGLHEAISPTSQTNTTMRNKQRLYIVNFFRIPTPGQNPDPYHWALTSGPKSGSMNGMLLYHVRNRMTPTGVQWIFEEPFRNLSNGPTPSLLALTAVAKITDLARLQRVIQSVPIDPNAVWQTFNCKTWVEQALQAIVLDGGCIGMNVLGNGWETLEQQCEMFANPIRQMRVAGQELPDPRPLQDLLKG